MLRGCEPQIETMKTASVSLSMSVSKGTIWNWLTVPTPQFLHKVLQRKKMAFLQKQITLKTDNVHIYYYLLSNTQYVQPNPPNGNKFSFLWPIIFLFIFCSVFLVYLWIYIISGFDSCIASGRIVFSVHIIQCPRGNSNNLGMRLIWILE